MRYIALACDYDGTLASDGRVSDTTIQALERVRASGRKLLLVTGRRLDDLASVFDRLDLFDRVVAENGALLADPGKREDRALAEAPPASFVSRLRQRGVAPLDAGRVIVATWRPQEAEVLAAIRDLGLELQVIFNKDAVMVLPPGVNKASGLMAALKELRLSPHNLVAVGDAENDHAMLQACECGVAVSNALPMLKERADLVTVGHHGAGVEELADRLVASDLADLSSSLARHDVLLGRRGDGQEVRVPAYDGCVLLAGPSGGGKSTLTNGVLERLSDAEYQFCLMDPEGDYEEFGTGVLVGTIRNPPDVEEVLSVLEAPGQNAIVNLTGVPTDERPAFFEQLLPRLLELRARTARPHWIIVDEAHHVLPLSWRPVPSLLPQRLHNVLMVTLEPGLLAPGILRPVTTMIALGDHPGAAVDALAVAVGERAPSLPPARLDKGQAALWLRAAPVGLQPFEVEPPREKHRRHRRKYAEGELIPEEHFVFRGPEGKLSLAAENLRTFLKMAEGVDEETWLHHLGRGEYSRWFRAAIKDEQLADEAAEVEAARLPAGESLARITEAIRRRYAL
jgi:HAD superfamily hydrolase (TIGR01484 family)